MSSPEQSAKPAGVENPSVPAVGTVPENRYELLPWCINTGKSLIPLTLLFLPQKRNLLIPLEFSQSYAPRQFIDVVGKLARSTGDRVDVVAHSMGGLITLAHLLTVGAEHMARVVFVGVPFGGSIAYLRDLHEGVGTGLDRSLLFPRSQFSFPSVYTLFPLGSTNVFRDQMGAAVPVDLFSADDWLRLGLGDLCQVFCSKRSQPGVSRAGPRPCQGVSAVATTLARAGAGCEDARCYRAWSPDAGSGCARWSSSSAGLGLPERTERGW